MRALSLSCARDIFSLSLSLSPSLSLSLSLSGGPVLALSLSLSLSLSPSLYVSVSFCLCLCLSFSQEDRCELFPRNPKPKTRVYGSLQRAQVIEIEVHPPIPRDETRNPKLET